MQEQNIYQNQYFYKQNQTPQNQYHNQKITVNTPNSNTNSNTKNLDKTRR